MMPHTPGTWFKSSRSKETQDCVEVNLDEMIGVRDTKDRDGGQLAVTTRAWSAFTNVVTNRK
jgi:hypothetical protein